jgi:TatD DNase family protein
MFSDCHCHLREGVEGAVKRAVEGGVGLILTAGIDLDSSRRAVEIAEGFGVVEACVGVHPWYANEYDAEVERVFRGWIEGEWVVAISEIGLDYVGRMTKDWVYQERVIDREVQREAFRAQLRLGREFGLPVIVHDRTPGFEVLGIIEEEGNMESGAVIHGFSKDVEYVERCEDLGIYLSIGLRPLRRGEPGLLEALGRMPLELLLTETDSGQPRDVVEVVEKVAELRDMKPIEIGRRATENLRELLRH